MSALFAFEVGDVSMKSLTFEDVITALLERSTDPVDQEVCHDALKLNCLWVDEIESSRKCAVIGNLHAVLAEKLTLGVYRDNWVAVFEIERLSDELRKRYPECLDR
jgi:hypothetical protein